eukprot:m.149445 g.149445  ORF g.149445 m.149445 type:complete len:108 (+) comp38525_c0_seq5:253-576(+)
MQIPSGWLADRWGGEIVLFYSAIGCGVMTISFPFCARSMEIQGVVLARFFLGLFQGALFPALSVLVSTRVPQEKRSQSLSLPLASTHWGYGQWSLWWIPTLEFWFVG